MEQRKKHSKVDAIRAQSVRVAGRIVKDWGEAQLAIIETRMVSTETVFLPYAIMRDGRTLGEHVRSDPRFLLKGLAIKAYERDGPYHTQCTVLRYQRPSICCGW